MKKIIPLFFILISACTIYYFLNLNPVQEYREYNETERVIQIVLNDSEVKRWLSEDYKILEVTRGNITTDHKKLEYPLVIIKSRKVTLDVYVDIDEGKVAGFMPWYERSPPTTLPTPSTI